LDGEEAYAHAAEARPARRMPRRHDGHTLDGDNVSPLATRRERQGNEPDDDIDDGATHLGTLNGTAPARRERQGNEPNDGIDDGATHLLGC
jgi:hypothetical protein